jgi:iron complex outermembrane receptor protein
VAYPDFDPIVKQTPTTYDNRVTSGAVADTLGFYDERLLVTVGIRHQRVESVSYHTATGAKILPAYEKSANTPTVGVVVKPLQNLSLYGNYIESLEQGPIAPIDSENKDEVFAPVASKQVEFGAKWEMETLGLTAAVFEIEKPSGMLNADNYYRLDGEQRNRGVELGAFGEISSDLRLLSGVTYIDSEWVTNANSDYDGNTLVGAPEWTAVLGLEWDLAAVPGLTLSGRVNHTGSQYVLNDHSREIPSYELYSVGARYRTSVSDNDVTIRANVDNLLNEEYWTTFVGLERLLYTGAPRQITLSVAVDI